MPHIGAQKLRDAVDASDTLSEPYRIGYADAIANYGGRYWGDGSDRKRQVINLGNRFVKTMVAHLSAGNPEHDVTAKSRQLRPFAALTQLASDHLADEQSRWKVSRTMLKMALLGPCAYLRLGLKAGSNTHTIDGTIFDMGQPFITPMSLDDIVVDPAGRCPEEFLWEGYRYRPYRASLYNTPKALWTPYGRSVIDKLPALEDGYDAERQRYSEQVSNNLPANDRFGLIDSVELIDIVIRAGDGRFVIVTISGDQSCCNDYLMVRDWEGPECGPLLRLEFDDMPGQPFGVPPVVTAREQSDLTNALLVKLANQLRRQKTVLGYMPGAQDEADQIRTARDGATIPITDPSAVQAYEVGAINTQIPGLANLFRGLADEGFGNVSILSGAQGGGDTATEYSGQQANASVLLGDMHRIHERFETKVSRAMAWYLHHDPMIRIPMVKRLPGGEHIDLVYDAAQREGDWLDYNITVRTNSMSATRHDPQVRQRRIIEMAAVAIQAAQASQATGGMLDLAGMLRVLGRELNIDALDEFMGDPVFQMERQMLTQSLPQFEGKGIPARGGMGGTSNRYTSGLGTTRGALSMFGGFGGRAA